MTIPDKPRNKKQKYRCFYLRIEGMAPQTLISQTLYSVFVAANIRQTLYAESDELLEIRPTLSSAGNA